MRTIALTLCALCLLCAGPAQATEPRTQDEHPRVLMHYMPWYESPDVRGFWGGHWTGWQKQHNPEQLDENGLPDIWSHYHPLIGLYDSADPAVVECQLLQMKLAGVDGVIADWYGISDANDYPGIHAATSVLFEQAGRLGMEFSVCYEDRTVEALVTQGKLAEPEIPEHLTEMVEWLGDHWFGAPHYSTVAGRPLLLNFGPIYVKDSPAWAAALATAEPRPAFYPLHHLWEGIDGDGGFTWVHKDVWHRPGEAGNEPTADEISRRLRAAYLYPGPPDRMIVSATPGFHDVYANSFGTLDHRDGATLREHLDVVMDGTWATVQLVTWNDYGEGTMFEPTHEFGYLFLEILQQDMRFRDPSFRFTAEDLRLPAKLLDARRSSSHSASRLDEISLMLAAGNVAGAREALASPDR
ncbi:MAG: hypothetical protein AAGG07_04425 [Planctomycetota bacterium]